MTLAEIAARGALVRVIQFDPVAVTVDAVQRAAYRMSDRLSIDIRMDETVECTVHLSEASEVESVLADFRNEVLDQVLRERIRTETAAARNLILALAFSNTGVVSQE